MSRINGNCWPCPSFSRLTTPTRDTSVHDQDDVHEDSKPHQSIRVVITQTKATMKAPRDNCESARNHRRHSSRQRMSSRLADARARCGCSHAGAATTSLISMISFLIILAHICHTSLPSTASGAGDGSSQLAGVVAAENMRQDGDNVDEMPAEERESWRSKPESMRDLRDARLGDKLQVNMSNVFEVMLKKRPYSKYWTVEQKWDDLFKRAMSVQGTVRQLMMKNFMRDIEYYADMTISPACQRDLKYIQNYVSKSTNMRWLAHMFDSTGKSEPGMLTGQLAQLGHPVQCIRVRAPSRPSNDSFNERFFEQQTEVLGERFRGKYCLASLRPVLPPKPQGVVVSRFSEIMDASLLSNISYTGEPLTRIKQRARQMTVPASIYSIIDREHLRLDQVPFESELYQYLIAQRNFMFTLPRFMGVCYPSTCTRDDIRISLQKTQDDQHQVVDIEFECEQEETSTWEWFNTPRLMAYVLLSLIGGLVFLASFTRYILLSKLQIRRSRLSPTSKMAGLLNTLEMFSMDKCAGILFVKTKRASPFVDWTKVENNRSTTIDALKGLLIFALIYSQLTLLGCLPVPFMWTKWSDAMFPFFRSLTTQIFINANIYSEAFYLISAYLIGVKILENYRPKLQTISGPKQHLQEIYLENNLEVSLGVSGSGGGGGGGDSGAKRAVSLQAGAPCISTSSTACRLPNFFSFAIKRYVRLAMPMLAFILFNYVWPRLSNGFVMQDQASKLMKPCDSFGWTNFLMFHNYQQLNETCLWPSHASASFFQLHLLSYPILVVCLMALHSQFNIIGHYDRNSNKAHGKLMVKVLTSAAFGLMGLLALFGAVYSALEASKRSLIVPFLIDYLDYDNYQRVLEFTVMPTHNHLTSYMIGLAVAFIVIRRKTSAELRKLEEASQWYGGQYSQREGSVDSIRSSSTQELHHDTSHTFRQLGGVGAGAQAAAQVKHFNLSSGESSVCDASSDRQQDNDEDEDAESSTSRGTRNSSLCCFIKSSGCCLICLGSLLASWLWNGLGQPMSDNETFWYMIMTKLCFCMSFAYLFHEHFATRRNSSNPWIITRFLVPIGRMSLTVFYISWLVVWFDLLASLHQWHPSHYFICEKYNEIMFMTLIVAMFVYGAFEGIFKRIQYASRLERVKHDIRLRISMANNNKNKNNNDKIAQHLIGGGALVGGCRQRAFRVKPFESFFEPHDKPTWEELAEDYQLDGSGLGVGGEFQPASTGGGKNKSMDGFGGAQLDPVSTVIVMDPHQKQQEHHPQTSPGSRPAYLTIGGASTGTGGDLSRVSTSCNLSPSDRYKLNAELRANYSFASIGLYESAGATGDLSNLSNIDPQDRKP